jgi:L-serine kinase (ADP)
MTIITEIRTDIEIRLVPIKELRPTEMINTGRFHSLAAKILREGRWTHPILVERENLIVMDGHHRLSSAGLLHLKCVPCLLLSYDDPRVSVTSWHDTEPFDVARIIKAGQTGQLLGFKTTRHRISGTVPSCAIPLETLA